MKFISLTWAALMLAAVYAEAAPQPAKAMVPIEGAVATVIKPPVYGGAIPVKATYAGGADMQTMTGWFTVEGEIQYKKK